MIRASPSQGNTSTYSLVVDDLDDGSQTAVVGVLAVDQQNTANLNEAPVGSLNQCFAHCDGIYFDVRVSRLGSFDEVAIHSVYE